MLSKSEAKRRARQSARDKARHQEEQRERARHQRQALRRTTPATVFGPSSLSDNSLDRQVHLKEKGCGQLEEQDMAAYKAESSIPQNGRFAQQLSELFNNRELADVEISVGELVVPAHRLVLCLQCKYFSDALTGNFKEGIRGALQCEPGKEHAYLRMLRYLYTGDYDEQPSSLTSSDDDPELQKHSRVYFLADSLFLVDLKTLALHKFISMLEKLWVSEGLVECISEVYNNTSGTDDMRDAVVNIVVKHREELLRKPAYEALLSNGGDFAVDLMAALVRACAKLR